MSPSGGVPLAHKQGSTIKNGQRLPHTSGGRCSKILSANSVSFDAVDGFAAVLPSSSSHQTPTLHPLAEHQQQAPASIVKTTPKISPYKSCKLYIVYTQGIHIIYSYVLFNLGETGETPLPDGLVKMDANEEQDRKIVLEFCHLLEKSKQLFNGLR